METIAETPVTGSSTDARSPSSGLRSVLVTGCSSGFGLRTAVALAERGWQVFASMRDPGRQGALREAAAGVADRIDVVRLDVCDAASVKQAVATVLERTGGTLDAVVHNAGIGAAGFFEDVPDGMFRDVVETNFFGPATLTREVLPAMRARGRGRIVVISSVAAFIPQPALSPYVSSKWAVEAWAETLAIEVAQFGIDVVLVEPGTYKTNIWTSGDVAESSEPYAGVLEAMEPRVRRMVDRFGRDPQEVADRVARLLDARRPRFRNPVGPDAWVSWALSRTVPPRLRRWALQKFVGLPSAPRSDAGAGSSSPA
jgi:NAD(P)-dependent dehydrogenase (short-subunit alcohol dehydrogenase family)